MAFVPKIHNREVPVANSMRSTHRVTRPPPTHTEESDREHGPLLKSASSLHDLALDTNTRA